jgi:hypothetical protein
MNNIGIGVLDFYTQKDLEDLLESLPVDQLKNVFVVSTTNNKSNCFTYKSKEDAPLGFLRNKILSHFRKLDKKNIFLIESNVYFTDPNYLLKIIQTAEVFGTWILSTPEKNSIILEDEEMNVKLHLTPHLNTSFLYLYSGVVGNIGYFNEQFLSSKGIEVLDFINRCRKRGIYPPFNFNPTVKDGISLKNTVNPFKISDESKKTALSLGLFQHLHKYIPGHNDPPSVSQETLLKEMETIQNNFAKKI